MALPSRDRQGVPIRVALEVIPNMLNSFALLNEVEQLPGLNTWVVQTAALLTPEQLRINRVLLGSLRDALTPLTDELDFPSYLRNLADQPPDVLRKRALEPLRRRLWRRLSSIPPSIDEFINDRELYLKSVQSMLDENDFDAELYQHTHHLLQYPPALQKLLLEHLAFLWQSTTLAAEWKRAQSSLLWQVEMFSQSLGQDVTIEGVFQEFTGRPLPIHVPLSVDITEIILIPSWHTGRQVTVWEDAIWDGEEWDGKKVVRLFFSEPPNYDVSLLRTTPMGRGELLARLDALSDETRLHILELLTQRDEMSAQDIITSLDLSQSSVLRHLKQLVSMKYLYERRSEGANKTYRLSSFYFARTAHALEQFVAGVVHRSATELLPSEQPLHALRRFLDWGGKLTLWPPAKQQDKLLVLNYLASFFKLGQIYSEKEVNELLLSHCVIKDAATLRRALYEYRFINRTRDGSRYWLSETDASEHVEQF